MTEEQLQKGQQIKQNLTTLKSRLEDLNKALQLGVKGSLSVGPYTFEIDSVAIKELIGEQYQVAADEIKALEEKFVAL